MTKNLITKVIVAILLLAMMLPLVVSCGETETTTKPTGTKPPVVEGTDDPESEETEPKTTTAAPTVAVDYPAQLEGIKDSIEDNVVQFVYVEGEEGFYTAKSIWVDEENAGGIF